MRWLSVAGAGLGRGSSAHTKKADKHLHRAAWGSHRRAQGEAWKSWKVESDNNSLADKTSYFIYLSWHCLSHGEVPKPGTGSTPQQQPTPPQWQRQILNPLCHQETPKHLTFRKFTITSDYGSTTVGPSFISFMVNMLLLFPERGSDFNFILLWLYWYIAPYKFKVYNAMIRYMYILQNVYHNKMS